MAFLCTVFAAPFTALVMAHEDISIYAGISMTDAIFKLVLVFILPYLDNGGLKTYAFFMFVAALVNCLFYIIIWKTRYKIYRFKIMFKLKIAREIMFFSVWNFWGSVVSICKLQIVNILLNKYFNPAVVAARRISVSIYNAVYSFAINYNVAMGPPIIKKYAKGEIDDVVWLLFKSSKFSYFLVYIFILPMVLEMPFVLSLWLGQPPGYSVVFSRILLADCLIDSIGNQFGSVAQATGKLRLYQIAGNGIIVLNAPLSLLFLFLGFPPYSVAVISAILVFFSFLVRLIILKKLIDFSLLKYVRKVLFPIASVTATTAIMPIFMYVIMKPGTMRFLSITAVSILITGAAIFWLGMNRTERRTVLSVAGNYLRRMIHQK
jgi:O-antigen/teichoic acid export membrane protein